MPDAEEYANKASVAQDFADKTNSLLGSSEKRISSTVKKLTELETLTGAYGIQLENLKKEYDENPTEETANKFNEIFDLREAAIEEHDSLLLRLKDYEAVNKSLIHDYNSSVKNYMSTSDDYNKAYGKWRSSIRESGAVSSELEATEKAISALNSKISEIDAQKQAIERRTRIYPFEKNSEKNREAIRELTEEFEKYELALTPLLKKKTALNEELSYAKDIERAEYYASYTERADFAEKSQYDEGKKTGETTLTYAGYYAFGYSDVDYEIINGNEEVRLQREANFNRAGTTNAKKYLYYFTDQEKSIYNYIYATEGRSSANEFVSMLEPTLNERSRKATEEKWEGLANEDAIGTSLVSVILNLGKPMALIGQIADYLDDGSIDQNASYNSASHITGAIRNTVSENLGGVGGFFYQTGMSLADFLAATAVSGGSGLSLAIMGSGAAADTTIAAKDRGLSDGQAVALGAAAGIIEIVTEKVSLDALLDKIGSGKSAVSYFIKNTLAEAGEEVSSEILNDAVDVLIAKDKSEWNESIRAYLANGEDQKAALLKAFRDQALEVALSGLGGALSGAVISAPGAAAKTFTKINHQKTVGKTVIKAEGGVDSLLGEALNYPEYTNGYKLAEKINKKIESGKKPTAAEVGKLTEIWQKRQSNGEALTEIERLAKEGRTLDEVEKTIRDSGYDIDTIAYAEIKDAYNEAIAAASTESNVDSDIAAVDKIKNAIPELSEMDAVSNLTGNEFPKSSKKLTEQVGEFFASLKNKITRKGFGEVVINNDGIKSSIAHGLGRAKAVTFAAVPDVIANGKQIDYQENWKGRGYNTYIFAAPVQIGEKTGYVGAVVTQSEETNKYYLHEVVDSEGNIFKISKDADLFKTGSFTDNSASTSKSASSDNIISQKSDSDNTFDENNNKNATDDNADDLDAPTENEITEHIAEIEEEQSWHKVRDSAVEKFYADETAFEKRLKEWGDYDTHPIRNARTETERSGYVYGASEREIAIAVRLSKALGRDILFFSEDARNGNIKNGVFDRDVIWINVKHDPDKTVTWIIAHELTHAIENTKAYDKLKDYVFDILGEEEVKRQRTELLDLYDRREIDYEIVSNYVADHLLTDEDAIMKLVQRNRSLGQKIKSILANILDKLGVGGKKTEEYLALEKVYKTYQKALAEQANTAKETDGAASEVERAKEKAIEPDDALKDDYIKNARERFMRGEITQAELNRLVDEYFDGEVATHKPKYSLSKNARNDVEKALYDKNYQGEIKLTDSSPAILISQKGVKNLPMIMKASHLRENIFTEAEAQQNGFKVSPNINYHGLGAELFLKVIDGLDNVTEAYRGTAKAERSERRENYFLLVSQYTDKDGNTINVPVYINERGLYNRVFIDANKISTVFGRIEFRKYISEQIKKGNLVRIKNRSNQTSESTSPINADYSKDASANSIPNFDENVNTSGENNFPFTEKAKNSKSATSDTLNKFAEKTRSEYLEVTGNLNSKSREYLERREREFVRRIGEVLHLSPDTKRGIVRDVARGIIAEQIKNGAVTENVARELFEHAYNEGTIKDDEYYKQYKELKNYLRNTAITISKQDRSDLGDWKAFKQSAQGKLNIKKEGGLPVDSAYMELMERYPELFPAEITHPGDQLQRMLTVANDIKVNEISLDEYFGENVEEAKEWMWNDFNQAVTDFTREIGFGKKYIENLAVRMAQEGVVVPDAKTLFETYKNLKKLRADASKAVARNVLTPVEENYVRDLLIGRLTLDQIPAEDYNIEGIKDVYEAKLPYEYASKVIEAYHNKRKSDQYARADELLEGYEDWNTVKMGFTLSMNTMERNFYNMIKDTDRAQAMIDEYIAPIHKREAQSTRYKNKFLDKIRELKISQKVAKGNRDTEAAAVQFIGEAESHIMRLESNKRLNKSGGMTLEEWQKALSDFKIANPSLDYKRISNCVRVFREIYNQLFDDMNKARMLNGYEPIDYRYAYFPHFHKDTPTGFWGRFAEVLGVPQDTQNLPATIAGMTENFKPGIRWLSAAQERRLTDTEYDCLEGFDRYIGGAADVIFHTESIQKLRSLANRIRYQASDEAIRAKIRTIEDNTEYSDEEKHEEIAKIAESKFALSAFVAELDEYTNLLAGKKLRADRQSEQDMGRAFYNWSAWFKRHFGANMIAGNIASAMTNFIPIAQAAGITKHQMLKAMYAQIRSMAVDDGFADRSDFLTNRIVGTDILSKKTSDKISDFLGTPMELIDGFSSGTIVRALYAQAKHDGLSDAEAMAQANTRAAEIMADRSKGAMPTIFSRSNFLTGIMTQFQLEVANQYAYMFKDLPRYYSGDKRKMLKVIASIFKIFILSYLFNDVYEAIVGRRPAFDTIDIVNNAIGDATGYQLPNMFDAIGDIIDGENFADVFKTEKKGVATAIKDTVTDTAQELPFVGGILGGGRIPISSAMPDIGKLYDTFTSDASGKKKLKTLVGELDSLLYVLPPFGGGQVRKALDAIPSIVQGGSYTYDNEGNRRLQYPTQTGDTVSDVLEAGRSLLLGKSSSRYAREWEEGGFSTLSAKQTREYEKLIKSGYPKVDAMDMAKEIVKLSENDMEVYEKLLGEGLEIDNAFGVVQKFSELEPINGKEKVSGIQKAEVIINNIEDRDIQMKVLEDIVTESTYKDMSFAYSEWYVPPYQFIEAESAIDAVMYEQGKTSESQAIVEEALRRCEMYDARRAALWQILTKSKKPENNPFHVDTAKQVLEDYEKYAN